MRHRKKTIKLGRTAEHRDALLANQVCSLIEHGRIKTTLAKAKAVRPFAERMLTLGKKGSLHNRRTAVAYLHNEGAVKQLFERVAPRSADRAGGYTRIVKLGQRISDAAPMAYLEWVDRAEEGEEKSAANGRSRAAAPRAEKKARPVAPAATGPDAEKTAAKLHRQRPTRARRVVDKVKRAEKKAQKQRSQEAVQAAKVKGRAASRKAAAAKVRKR